MDGDEIYLPDLNIYADEHDLSSPLNDPHQKPFISENKNVNIEPNLVRVYGRLRRKNKTYDISALIDRNQGSHTEKPIKKSIDAKTNLSQEKLQSRQIPFDFGTIKEPFSLL